MVVTLRGYGEAWCHLPFAPDAQNARVRKVDAPLAVQSVETFDDVVWLAWPGHEAFSGGIPRAFSPGNECCHSPQPCFLGVMERLGRWSGMDVDAIHNGILAAGNGHEGRFQFNLWRELIQGFNTIGCIRSQVNMVHFPIPFSVNS
jgi:hypothetical protein